jgi:hypothetical protein
MPFFKPPRLTRARRLALLRAAKAASKARDQHRCRWPRHDHDTPGRVCLGVIQSAHRVAIGMGGNPDGTRTSTGELLTVCGHIHLAGKLSLEQHGRLWRGLTDAGADGPIEFLRVGQDRIAVVIGREIAVGVLDPLA